MFFVFNNWICEHCVILRFFFLASLPVSFLLHFASSLCLPLSFVSVIVSFGAHHLFLGIVHLCVGRVALIT